MRAARSASGTPSGARRDAIGAGRECDGQVLVLYDMLGITPGRRPKFSRDFLSGRDSIPAAIAAYAADVRAESFPADENILG